LVVVCLDGKMVGPILLAKRNQVFSKHLPLLAL
jgi:hypothetical protein